MKEVRIPVTRLKDYLAEVGIAVTTLADMAQINPVHLHKCLAAEVDPRNGSVHTMSDDALERLQEALHQMALSLKHLFIYYNTDLEVVKKNGRRYCPDCIEQVRRDLSPLVSIIPFLEYALDWNRSKVRNVLDRHSASYGNISSDDCDRINLRMAEVATRLELLTLVKS